jgi:hypothetical protein
MLSFTLVPNESAKGAIELEFLTRSCGCRREKNEVVRPRPELETDLLTDVNYLAGSCASHGQIAVTRLHPPTFFQHETSLPGLGDGEQIS